MAKVLRGAQNKLLKLRDGFPQEQQLAKAKKERRQFLALRMSNAETREQWGAAAKELDILESTRHGNSTTRRCVSTRRSSKHVVFYFKQPTKDNITGTN